MRKTKKEKKPSKFKSYSKKKKALIVAGIIAAVILAILVAGYVLLGTLLNADESVLGWKNSALVDEFGNPILLDNINSEKRGGDYNILVGCTDKGGTRTDTILLVNFDTKNDKIACMSIPRDTYIATDRSSKKINSCYAYGKSDEFVSKVESTFGIDVDYYAIIDIDTFKNAVDAMDGVEIDVQFDMDYDDPAQDLHIHIPAGLQTLNGEQAEGFVRYRKGYAGADLTRIQAQRVFLASAAKKLQENPKYLTKVISAVFEGVKTDIKQANAIKIATSALDIDFSEIKMFTLPGTAASHNGVSYYSMYKEQTLKLINEYFNSYKEDITESQCAMIELRTPTGTGDVEGETLEEASQATPPKKTVNFSQHSSSSDSGTAQTEITEPAVYEMLPEVDETPDAIEEEPEMPPTVGPATEIPTEPEPEVQPPQDETEIPTVPDEQPQTDPIVPQQ